MDFIGVLMTTNFFFTNNSILDRGTEAWSRNGQKFRIFVSNKSRLTLDHEHPN